MAISEPGQRFTAKSAELGKAQFDIHQGLVSQQANNDVLSSMLPVAAVGGIAGVASSLYDSYQQKKKLEKIRNKINFDPTAMPLVGKSAFLKAAMQKAANVVTDFLGGRYAQGALSHPLFLPGAALAAYGSYRLGKGVADKFSQNSAVDDSQEELAAEKARYMQAVNGAPATPAAPMAKMANNYTPAFFSMDNLGAPLGAATGVLGAAGVASFLSRYHAAKAQKEKERFGQQAAGLESDIANLRPKVVSRPTTVAPFA